MNWETVIGLEVHAELSTKSKIFCSCAVSFGDDSNTRCCPVCLGLPGTMPNLNQEVLRFAVKACLALGCQIRRRIAFDRKNYFYPDLPKSYQITQHRYPIGFNGMFQLPNGKEIRIEELHMEEDAGKLLHMQEGTICDDNRCGVPLLEIVTCPDFRDADEVVTFLASLQRILQYLGISDGKMQEGSLRADVNISVHKSDERLGQRVEMKNLSSFRAIKEAIQYEYFRQTEVLESGKMVAAETRGWNEDKKETYSLRNKEKVQDYRYFPEPDIPEIIIEENWVKEIQECLPELPAHKMKRYMDMYRLTDNEANILTADRSVSAFFEELIACGIAPKLAAKWILREVLAYLNEHNAAYNDLSLSAKSFSDLIFLTEAKKINRQTAKDIFSLLCKKDFDVPSYVKTHSLWLENNDAENSKVVSHIISIHQKAVLDFCAGKEKVLGFLVGQCMKELKGRGNPEVIKEILINYLKNEMGK